MRWWCVSAIWLPTAVWGATAGCSHRAPKPVLLPISVAANYLAGALARDADHHPEAARAFANAAVDAPAVFPLVEQALATARAGDAQRGLALAQAGVARFAGSADLWLAIGQLSIAAKGPAREAQQAFARARRLAPDDERGYLMAARAETNPAQQLQLARALLQRKPRSLDGNMTYAELLGRTALDANSAQARADLATLLHALRVALEVEPNQLDARLSLATALLAADDGNQAIVEARNAFPAAAMITRLGYWLCDC